MRRLLSLRASAARAPPEGGTDHVAEAVRLVDERNLGTCTTHSSPSRRRHPLRFVLFFVHRVVCDFCLFPPSLFRTLAFCGVKARRM